MSNIQREDLCILEDNFIEPCKCGNIARFRAVIQNPGTNPLQCAAWLECIDCGASTEDKPITPKFNQLSRIVHFDLVRSWNEIKTKDTKDE